MEKFIPYEKLSKKEKRRLDSAKRGTWGEMNPVTRRSVNSRAYNRKKARNWRTDLPDSVPCLLCKSIANKLDAPFSRPFGATEKDAQILHALELLPMIVVCNTAHEV